MHVFHELEGLVNVIVLPFAISIGNAARALNSLVFRPCILYITAMRKRSRVAFILLLLLVLGAIAWLTLRQNEPVYEGKALSVWLEVYHTNPQSDDPAGLEALKAADEAVRHMGTNVIPTLLRELQAEDSQLKLKWVALFKKQRFIKLNFTQDYMRQQAACSAFNALGSEGRSALPELMALYENPRFSQSPISIMGAIASIGPEASPAVPDLLRGLGDTNRTVVLCVEVALGRIHAQPGLVVPALLKCLSDPDFRVRRHAAYSLADFGADAKPAISALVELLQDKNAAVRQAAAEALPKIDPEAAAKAGVK
ncbi:MAG: repeat-containing protein [Pedosphaera sp.]|nr:repeat-containing protein [Pedosphaera sp.]